MRIAACSILALALGACGALQEDDEEPRGSFDTTGAGLPDATDGPTATYANGHPLNWLTTDLSVVDAENQAFNLVNVHRTSLGLDALILVPALTRCARGHSHHMLASCHDFFDHLNPEGQQPWDRMTSNGISWVAAGENIAGGYSDAQTAVAAWLNSPGHRANIERVEFTHTGVGNQTGMWTQMFAK